MESKLTYKQAAFCREYVTNNGNATQAYKAVYNWTGEDEGARVEACLLMKNPAIKAEIDALTHPKVVDCESTVAERVAFLKGVMDDPNEKMENRLRASDILNRMYGVYIQKTENTNKDTLKLDTTALESLLSDE